MWMDDFSKPLWQRRPKIMERMPEPPRGNAFEIDEEKLRQATEPTDAWLETRMGKLYLLFVKAVAAAVLVALVAALIALCIAFPGFGAGLVIFFLIMAFSVLDTPSAPRQ